MPILLPYEHEAQNKFSGIQKTFVEVTGSLMSQGFFHGIVSRGDYNFEDPEGMVTNAWITVGLIPGCRGIFECHLMAGDKQDEPFLVSELLDSIEPFSKEEKLTQERSVILANTLHKRLGSNKHHILGVLSLHQTKKIKYRSKDNRRSFVILWYHPKVGRSIVEKIMEYQLNRICPPDS